MSHRPRIGVAVEWTPGTATDETSRLIALAVRHGGSTSSVERPAAAPASGHLVLAAASARQGRYRLTATCDGAVTWIGWISQPRPVDARRWTRWRITGMSAEHLEADEAVSRPAGGILAALAAAAAPVTVIGAPQDRRHTIINRTGPCGSYIALLAGALNCELVERRNGALRAAARTPSPATPETAVDASAMFVAPTVATADNADRVRNRVVVQTNPGRPGTDTQLSVSQGFPGPTPNTGGKTVTVTWTIPAGGSTEPADWTVRIVRVSRVRADQPPTSDAVTPTSVGALQITDRTASVRVTIPAGVRSTGFVVVANLVAATNPPTFATADDARSQALWGVREMIRPDWLLETAADGRSLLATLGKARRTHTLTLPLQQPTAALSTTAARIDAGHYLRLTLVDPARGVNVNGVHTLVTSRRLEINDTGEGHVTLECLETGRPAAPAAGNPVALGSAENPVHLGSAENPVHLGSAA